MSEEKDKKINVIDDNLPTEDEIKKSLAEIPEDLLERWEEEYRKYWGTHNS